MSAARSDLVFAASIGALVTSFVLLHLSELGFSRALPASCNQVLDAYFPLTRDVIHPYLTCMGETGRAMYLEFYRFDLFLFPLIYSTMLYGAISRLWPSQRVLLALPVLAALSDVTENISMCFVLTQFPVRHVQLEFVISVLTNTKWVLCTVSIVTTLVGIGRRLVFPATHHKTK